VHTKYFHLSHHDLGGHVGKGAKTNIDFMHVVIPSSIINGIAILVEILNRYVGRDDKQIGVGQ
jgi:hypothetical protein